MNCKHCGLRIKPNPYYTDPGDHVDGYIHAAGEFFTCEFANWDEDKRLDKWQDASGQPLTATPMDAGQTEPLVQNISSILTLVPRQLGTKVLKFPKPRAKRKKKSTLPEVVGRKFRSVPSGV